MQPFGTSRIVLRSGYTSTTTYTWVEVNVFRANWRPNLGYERVVR